MFQQPPLSQGKVTNLIEAVGLLLGDPLLDTGALSDLKDKLGCLLNSLETVLASLVKDAKGRAARDADAGPAPGAFGFLTASCLDNQSVVYKAQVAMVVPKFAKIWSIMASTPYHMPVSLSLFMPNTSWERHRYLEELQLPDPAAVVKVAVGGSIGSLSWVVRRPPEMPVGADSAEMTEAVGCIMGMVPLYLSKARRLLFHKKLSQVATISSSASAALFREITGDQTLADGDEKKKREAYVEEFVMLVGDPEVLSDLVLDMRAHSNAQRLGKTAYQDFWDCALKILDMMQTEAEQRRHGGIVVFASEVISQNAFYKQVCDRFDIEQQAVPPRIGVEATKPTQRWLEMQLWPRDEHSASAELYSGRVPLRMALMRKTLRKHHAHKMYCMAQKILHEAFLRHYLEYAVYMQVDDKAIIPIGAPGAAVAATSRARATPGPTFRRGGGGGGGGGTAGGGRALGHDTVGIAVAMDHDAGHVEGGVIVTVSLVVELTKDPSDSKYKGNVLINCKNKFVEASSADRAKLEIWRIVDSPVGDGKHVLGIHGDGGGELNVQHPSVQFAMVNLFLASREKFDKVQTCTQ